MVTDGPWDMCRFMVSQCKLSGVQIPTFAKKWCNIRKVFGNFYGTRRLRLMEMLFHLGESFIHLCIIYKFPLPENYKESFILLYIIYKFPLPENYKNGATLMCLNYNLICIL